MDGLFLYAYLHLCMLNSPYRHRTLFVMLNLPMICKQKFINPFFTLDFQKTIHIQIIVQRGKGPPPNYKLRGRP